MARPGILRADTLDLQDHDAPSAKSHPHPHPHLQHGQQQQDDAWGSGRSSHEGSELLEEDADFLTDGGNVPMDLRGGHDQSGTNRSSEDSDMTDGDDDGADDDLVDKISSSPSINDDEDIDFEFVYALHTFVATVEGQANATKGDTMVLLDDSNSYWWLVRVVKDSSIGYLPAEHIETPTERLARLNKHRNADLAQQMLTDSSEKSKNPLKKAMRRRNAKMVQFTAPTYYDASENEWSDAEEGQDDMDLDSRPAGDAQQSGDSSTTSDSAAANTSATASSASGNASDMTEHQKDGLDPGSDRSASADATAQERGLRIDPDQANREAFEGKDAPSISKNGNIRNTDSFFKDDTAEPKKMSLTPTLLRDAENASADSPRTSEQIEPSPISDTFDQLDKSTSPTSDKFKEDKKKKEKKPGMLSGLFKRKDKKIKVDEAAGGTVRSSKDGETLLGSPTSSPGDSVTATPAPERSPQPTRKSSGNKLVKSPPQSALTTNNSTAAASSASLGSSSASNNALKPAPLSPSNAAGPTSPLPQAAPEQQRGLAPSSAEALNGKPTGLRVNTGGPPTERKEGGLLSPLSNLLPQSDQPKKEKLKRAKQRIDLDVDSSPERESSSPSSRNASHTPPPRHGASATQSEPFGDGLVSPVDKHPPSFDSLGNPRSHSPVSRSPTPTETASTVQTPQSEPEPKTSTAASSTVPPDHRPTASEESSDMQWDDVALRNYLDERGHDDVRDLLIRVHDRSEVVPLPDNHPTMMEIGFHETQAQLDAMFTQLDGMLYSFLDRCAARRAAREAAAAPAVA